MKTKPKKIKLNVGLFNLIKAAITKEPKRMNMCQFADYATYRFFASERPACNTVGCIAGWGIILESGKPESKFQTLVEPIRELSKERKSVVNRAAKLLGINKAQAEDLFFLNSWPIKFNRRLEKFIPGTAAYARVVCQRIDHFIKTGE